MPPVSKTRRSKPHASGTSAKRGRLTTPILGVDCRRRLSPNTFPCRFGSSFCLESRDPLKLPERISETHRDVAEAARPVSNVPCRADLDVIQAGGRD